MNDKSIMMIVSVTPYKEADGAIVAISKDFGVLTLIAKGLFKPTSKHIGLIQPLSTVDVLFDKREGLSLFKSATMVHLFKPFTNDLLALSVATLMLQLISKNSEQQLLLDFEVIIEYLAQLSNKDAIAYLTHFLITCSQKQGVGLQLDYCVSCQSTQISALSISQGGFLCQRCASKVDHQLFPLSFYKALRCGYKAKLDQFEQCALTYSYTLDHVELLLKLLGEALVIPWKNWQFIKEL